MKNKLNKLSLGGAFVILWLATIVSFIFTIDTRNNEGIFSSFLTTLFLGNILIGITVFLLAIFSKSLFKNFRKAKVITYAPSIALVYFLFYVTALTVNGHGLIASQMGLKSSTEVIESTLIPTPSESPTAIPISQQEESAYVDPDPIIDCAVTKECGGGTQRLRKSECSQSVCCQINKAWYKYPNKTACIQAQNNSIANTYPPCTVYYPSLGYSRTYNLSPSNCLYYQQLARTSTQPLSLPKIEVAPLPTMAPYQYSQEYINAMNKFNQEISKPYQPSQFVAPTQKCYTTWDEYFNAHPNYAPQNIQGMSGTPPCD